MAEGLEIKKKPQTNKNHQLDIMAFFISIE
jgi:hypothetical protein